MRPAAPASARWTVVALLCAMSFMSYFDRTIMGIAGSHAIQKEFALDDGALGAILWAFTIPYAVLMIPGGRLSDRIGPHRMLAVVGFGSAIFTCLTAIGGSPALGMLFGAPVAFILVRGLMGAFTAPLYPGCARANANWVPAKDRNLVQGLIAAGAGLGTAVSPGFKWLIDSYGWRRAFVYAGLATVALSILWVWVFRNKPQNRSPAGGTFPDDSLRTDQVAPLQCSAKVPWGKLLRSPHLLLLTLSYFTTSYFMYVFFYWTFHFLKRIRGLTEDESVWATLVINLGWAALSPIGGWASDRLVRRWGHRSGMRFVPIVSLLMSAVCLAIGVWMPSPWAGVAFFTLSFGLAMATDAPYWTAAIQLGGRDVAAACSIMNTGSNLGGVSTWITAVIAGRFGWDWGLYSATAVMVAGAVLWFFIDVTRTAGGSESPP